MKLITTADMRQLIKRVGLEHFNKLLLEALQQDFSRWHEFQLSPRHATHYPHGVIELMPCADDRLYAYKYVNGHPRNTKQGKLCVVAVGMLAEVDTGYPLLMCEMTWLTALRTAATAALGAHYLARRESEVLGIIGCGAQSEFQVLALAGVCPLKAIRYYDLDGAAMAKFARNLSGRVPQLIACKSGAEAVQDADLIVTATAAKCQDRILNRSMIAPGTHIHAMGGDCPGKTELDPALLDQVKIVVEYQEQSMHEGEVQNRPDVTIHAELWEIVSGQRPGRENDHELTLFDSVGFALEDYTALRLVNRLAEEHGIGSESAMIPVLDDPKDLFGGLV
ncbi:MAG: ornithine cyclodeaminase [Candidatus Polarisedimenticolaceae bacterium]|nr:ornithine cyclodeaminase [Candidatus Polarisedimenticolaceae bacterium]